MVCLVRQLYNFNPQFKESIEFSFIILGYKNLRFKNNIVNVFGVADTELPSKKKNKERKTMTF